jgi:hypothetical protein
MKQAEAILWLMDAITDPTLVCPYPSPWHDLWLILRARAPGRQEEPPQPLILALWHGSSDKEKHECFVAQLRWAVRYGALLKAVAFLTSLPPKEWARRDRRGSI